MVTDVDGAAASELRKNTVASRLAGNGFALVEHAHGDAQEQHANTAKPSGDCSMHLLRKNQCKRCNEYDQYPNSRFHNTPR